MDVAKYKADIAAIPTRSRIWRSTGMSRSAHSMRALPVSARFMFVTSLPRLFAALSLMSQGRHKFVDLGKGDTVLISAKPIPVSQY